MYFYSLMVDSADLGTLNIFDPLWLIFDRLTMILIVKVI